MPCRAVSVWWRRPGLSLAAPSPRPSCVNMAIALSSVMTLLLLLVTGQHSTMMQILGCIIIILSANLTLAQTCRVLKIPPHDVIIGSALIPHCSPTICYSDPDILIFEWRQPALVVTQDTKDSDSFPQLVLTQRMTPCCLVSQTINYCLIIDT